MLFLQGACGDINPVSGVTSDYEHCRSLGRTLGNEVAQAHRSIAAQAGDVRLAARTFELELPLQSLPGQPTSQPQTAELEEARDWEFPWLVPTGQTGPVMEVQVLALGDLAMALVAAEPFTETGMAVKSASGWTRTFFVGYANGCVGYIPTADAYPNGGYEVNVAHLLYGLPAPVSPEAEHMVVQACTDALESASLLRGCG